MKLKHGIEKLNDYLHRLDNNEAPRIKPDHVTKVINKLQAKKEQMIVDRDAASDPKKRAKIEAKLEVIDTQIERGEWLMQEIGGPSSEDRKD